MKELRANSPKVITKNILSHFSWCLKMTRPRLVTITSGEAQKHQMIDQREREEVSERASKPLYCLLFFVLLTPDGA